MLYALTDLYPLYRKWDPVEPSSGVWNWKGSDAIASYLQGHKRGLRGHAGLWDQALPGWVNGLVRGGVADALHQHVFEVVRRYGKVTLHPIS